MQYSDTAQAHFSLLSTPLPKVQNLDFGLELKLFLSSQKSLETSHTIYEKNPEIFSNQLGDDKNEKEKESEICPQVPSKLLSFSQVKEFKLVLGNNIENPLCKCKYFCFKVYLKPLQEFLFPREEKVQLKVCVLRNDGQRIMRNMKGGNILKGNFLQNLSFFTLEEEHSAFFRIQITEVSSYYPGKTMNIKIIPQNSEFMLRTQCKIQPLSVENFVIKAKIL